MQKLYINERLPNFIETKKVCDGTPQCNLGQDESEGRCGTLSIYAIVPIATAVVVLVAISIYMARKTQILPLACYKCDKPYRRCVKMRYGAWKLRLKFLSDLMGKYCPELQKSVNRKSTT